MQTRRTFLSLALAGVAAIGLAACGSESNASSGAAGTTTTAGGATTTGSTVAGATTTAAEATTTTSGEKVTLRLGYFPNITHATALNGLGKGIFAEKLGANVTLEPTSFNAGPKAVEAIFADALDASFIGPNPAINAYAQSNGEAVRIVSGSTSGGAFLVVKPTINTPADLEGKKIATPQLGNTQDVALRSWLKEQGYTTNTEGGGDVSVVPQENSQTLQTFIDGQIDGAWVPEPWATRLITEGGGKVLVDERDLWPDGKYVTTHLIVATKFLEKHPDVVKRLLEGQVAATEFVNDNAAEAQKVANAEIEKATGKPLKESLIEAAWKNLAFTVDPVASSLQKSATDAQAVGLLKPVDLKGIYDLTLLNEVLKGAGQPEVKGL